MDSRAIHGMRRMLSLGRVPFLFFVYNQVSSGRPSILSSRPSCENVRRLRNIAKKSRDKPFRECPTPLVGVSTKFPDAICRTTSKSTAAIRRTCCSRCFRWDIEFTFRVRIFTPQRGSFLFMSLTVYSSLHSHDRLLHVHHQARTSIANWS